MSCALLDVAALYRMFVEFSRIDTAPGVTSGGTHEGKWNRNALAPASSSSLLFTAICHVAMKPPVGHRSYPFTASGAMPPTVSAWHVHARWMSAKRFSFWRGEVCHVMRVAAGEIVHSLRYAGRERSFV